MPFQVNYTDASGVNHPESYWKLSDVVTIDRDNKVARFKIMGYHNKAKYDLKKSDVGVIFFNITNTDFDNYLSTASLSPEGENPYKKAYEFAKAKITLFTNAIDFDL